LVVKELLTADTRPKQPEKRFVDGKPTTEEYWDALITNNNEELSSDKLLVRFGFCVNHSVLKKFPTDDFIGKTAEDLLYDENARAECPAYAPVAVLHESLDGEWYYVACCNYAGWIRKENIALCESKESWLDRQNPEEFLEEAQGILQILEENPEFDKLMKHPGVPKQEKLQVVREIFKGRVSNELAGFLEIVVSKERYNDLPAIFAYFTDKVKEAQKIGVAFVASAVELTETQKEKVCTRLLETTSYEQMEMHYSVDPSLIGGMVIRVNDRVVDSSIRTKLNNMTKQLL
jgi:F-type H+-transporting ATPase subunit delta